MKVKEDNLKKILVTPGFISLVDFESAVNDAGKKNVPIDDILVERGLIKDEELGQLIANDIGFSYINLSKERIDEKLFAIWPEVVARERQAIAFNRDKDVVKVGMINPTDIETWKIIEKKFGQKIKAYLITKRDLQHALLGYKPGLNIEYANLLEQIQKDANKDGGNMLASKIVDLLIEYGQYNKASDIHIEPGTNIVKVRFRIDGVMHNVLEISKEYYELIVSRIKIMSKMRIDEHLAPQDGKIRFKVNDKKIDLRVSIVPVIKGENIVMRILSVQSRQMTLESLGFGAADLKKVRLAMKSTAGMILVTGPTGSGKTTSIYEILKILNKENVHISSIEDPVEYDIEGVSQIQVNPKTNLTFASGLRAIVRQDPDIIMVGEIRDEETAQIAVNSAMTGHLVLSSLHANDAATTLPRLLDMGIEPFLVASTVKIIIAQRLVRTICEKCRASYLLQADEKDFIRSNTFLYNFFSAKDNSGLDNIRLYKGAGCKVCANTGYSGRIGIFEVLIDSQTIKELIIRRASSEEILQAARHEGMTMMIQDGIEKVFNGVTSLEELLRVVQQ